MAEQLKNVYTKEYIQSLAFKIKDNYSEFEDEAFINSIFDLTWQSLELKDRMRHIAKRINQYLPLNYNKQLEILKVVSKDFSGYEAMFFQDFVELYGLEDFEDSMEALEVFTLDSSSEFAIRQFIIKYEDKTIDQMKLWANSSNEHLRRLASEGCRPRLPWAVALPRFKQDPKKVLEIIELLKKDSSKYVQKSVANNLNDISKDNPEFVIAFLINNLGKTKQLDWICRHGSRTLLKNGNKKVLELFGFKNSSHIEVLDFKVDEEVELSKDLNFSFSLKSLEELGNVRVEYIIYYKKANNKHNKKIFMIMQNEIKAKNKSFTKKQSFKQMTTRKHYKGEHFISIVINGEEKIKKEFKLK